MIRPIPDDDLAAIALTVTPHQRALAWFLYELAFPKHTAVHAAKREERIPPPLYLAIATALARDNHRAIMRKHLERI